MSSVVAAGVADRVAAADVEDDEAAAAAAVDTSEDAVVAAAAAADTDEASPFGYPFSKEYVNFTFFYSLCLHCQALNIFICTLHFNRTF